MGEYKQFSTGDQESLTEDVRTHSTIVLCRACGREFSPSRHWQRFCSTECRKQSWNKYNNLNQIYARVESLEKKTRERIESLEQRVKELESK